MRAVHEGRRSRAETVLAAIRTIFAQPDTASARAQLDEVAGKLTPRLLAAAELLVGAREDPLAYTAYPFAHWRKT